MNQADYSLIAACVHRSAMVSSIGKRKAAHMEGANRALRLVAGDLAATLHHADPSLEIAAFMRACGFIA